MASRHQRAKQRTAWQRAQVRGKQQVLTPVHAVQQITVSIARAGLPMLRDGGRRAMMPRKQPMETTGTGQTADAMAVTLDIADAVAAELNACPRRSISATPRASPANSCDGAGSKADTPGQRLC